MKRAFTLIELLVVIAIIAILAAILFPVFAQAKGAAKDTVTLSNIKQEALANIMYTNDYDDQFTLCAIVTQNESQLTPWQELVYPYTKSHDLALDPKLPRPIPDTGGVTTGENLFARDSHLGMMPRAVTQFYPDGGWTWGLSPRTQLLTGGLTPSLDGILGAGDDAANPGWYNPSSSLSTTAIASPSNTYLVGQASNWDFWTGAEGIPFEYFVYWLDEPSNAWPGMWQWSGPTVLKNPANSLSTGYCPQGTGLPPGATAPTNADGIPNGMTIFATTDGSAHVKDVRGDVMRTVMTSSGKNVMNRFWPSGQ